MIRGFLLASALLALAGPGFAQTADTSGSGAAPTIATATMGQLLTQGYEIKAAVPNGAKFVIFMQKDQSAYACEFVSITNTKCGAIN